MRDNFNVHEWRIDQIRKENTNDDAAKRVDIVTDHILDAFPEMNKGLLKMVVAGAFTELAIQQLIGESLNEDKADAVRWFGNLKYYYQKAFAELKGEDRETYKQLAKDFFSKLEIDQHVLPVGLDEGWNDDIDKVSLIYTNYGDLYKVKIDGKTVNAKDVEGLVGMEIPDNGFDTESINQFIDELKRKGITADSYEMDVD